MPAITYDIVARCPSCDKMGRFQIISTCIHMACEVVKSLGCKTFGCTRAGLIIMGELLSSGDLKPIPKPEEKKVMSEGRVHRIH